MLAAPELIAAKARDILRHYVATVMPDGFKGMIVATSREACLRYHAALSGARDELVAELDRRREDLLGRPGDSLDADESFMRAAAGQVDLIGGLEFAPVISGEHNDPPHYAPWTDKGRQQERIDGFRLPLGPAGEDRSPLALLIVQSMLLTGFDAPQAQVLYLDRLIQEAELLQAVARVNRTALKKFYGLVVDYHGVSSQLTAALAVYTNANGEIDPDADGALRPLTAEIEKLEPQRQRVRQIFVQRGIEPAATVEALEACVQLLADERLRAGFDVALRTFLTTFDTVLPRPEALRFVADANLFGEIQILTRRRYRDTPDGDFDPRKYSEKVRRLIDQHMTVLDLSRRIPPVRITDPAFGAHVAGIGAARARASEMEHAVRHHIREHLDEDPVYYGRLSQRIDEILERLEERWEQIALEFEELIADINAGRTDEDDTGLEPTTELPFHNQMAEKVAGSGPDTAERLVALTRGLVGEIRRIIGAVGFWDNATKQDDLRKAIKRTLDESDLFAYESLDELAVELVALAKANQAPVAVTSTAVASAIDATAAPSVADDTAASRRPIHELPALVVGDLVLTVAPPSDRTTIEIVVERDATLVLKAPPAVTVERATQFVTAKRRWVYRKLAEKDALTGPPIVKQFVEGEGFAYLGRSHRLTLTADTPGVRLNQGRPVQQARPDPARTCGPARSPPRARPLPSGRSGGRPGRRRDAQLVHQRRRSMAATQDPPLGGPPG